MYSVLFTSPPPLPNAGAAHVVIATTYNGLLADSSGWLLLALMMNSGNPIAYMQPLWDEHKPVSTLHIITPLSTVVWQCKEAISNFNFLLCRRYLLAVGTHNFPLHVFLAQRHWSQWHVILGTVTRRSLMGPLVDEAHCIRTQQVQALWIKHDVALLKCGPSSDVGHNKLGLWWFTFTSKQHQRCCGAHFNDKVLHYCLISCWHHVYCVVVQLTSSVQLEVAFNSHDSEVRKAHLFMSPIDLSNDLKVHHI